VLVSIQCDVEFLISKKIVRLKLRGHLNALQLEPTIETINNSQTC